MATNPGFDDEDAIKTEVMDAANHEVIPMGVSDHENEKGNNKEDGWLTRQIRRQFCLPHHSFVGYMTIIVISGLVWFFLFLILNEEVLFNGGLFKLLLLCIVAWFSGFIVSLLKLPPLLGMLLTGVVFRAVGYFNVSGVYRQIVIVLRNIALTVILIKAGLGLDPEALMKLKCFVLKLAILPCLAEAVATGILGHYALGYPWLWSLLLGFLLSPISPAVVVPTLLSLKERGYGNDKGISTLVIAASSLDDILSISIFGVLLSSIFSIGSLTMAIVHGPLELIMGITLGFIWGLVCTIFPHRNDNFLVLKRTILIGLGGVTFVLGSIHFDYPGSGPLACIISAFIANISWKLQGWGKETSISPVSDVFSKIWLIVQPILFGLIGSEIDVRILQPQQVGEGVAIILGALLVRMMVCFLCLIGGNLDWKEMLFVNFAWLPKATVQAALSPQPLDYLRQTNSTDEYAYELANFVLITAVVAIIITAPIGAIAISISGPHLLHKTE